MGNTIKKIEELDYAKVLDDDAYEMIHDIVRESPYSTTLKMAHDLFVAGHMHGVNSML